MQLQVREPGPNSMRCLADVWQEEGWNGLLVISWSGYGIRRERFDNNYCVSLASITESGTVSQLRRKPWPSSWGCHYKRTRMVSVTAWSPIALTNALAV